MAARGGGPRHKAPFFDARERAALHWAEIVTGIPQRDPSDAEFAALQKHPLIQDTKLSGDVARSDSEHMLL
jgi:alkylhydroperoxidase family enzyme